MEVEGLESIRARGRGRRSEKGKEVRLFFLAERVLLGQSLQLCWLWLARTEIAKQEVIERLKLWKRSTILVESENTCSHRLSGCKCLELSEDKMYITLQATLMTARHHRLETTTCFRGIHRFICIFLAAGWRSHREESRHSSWSRRQTMCW